MTSETHSSVRMWVIAFLSADIVFWILIGFGCLFQPIECVEGVGFALYFFSSPFRWLYEALPFFQTSLGFSGDLLRMAAFNLVVHALVGLLFGIAFVKMRVRAWIAEAFALLVIFGLAFGFTQREAQQAFEQDTVTRFRAIYDFAEGTNPYTGEPGFRIEDTQVDWINDPSAPNGFHLKFYDEQRGESWWNARELENASVSLITCNDDGCGNNVSLSPSEYVAARIACRAEPLSCPYYSVGAEVEFFNVTTNPNGIASFRQVYLP